MSAGPRGPGAASAPAEPSAAGQPTPRRRNPFSRLASWPRRLAALPAALAVLVLGALCLLAPSLANAQLAARPTLSALVVTGGGATVTLQPSFSPTTETYTASVPANVASVTVTPTAAASPGVDLLTVNDVSVASGATSQAIALATDAARVIEVLLLTADNSERTYTVTVTRGTIASSVPGAVGSLAVTPGNQRLAVTWAAPATDGGSAVTGYDVAYKVSTASDWTDAGHSGTTASHTISSLVNGTAYDVSVRAVNAIGAGPWADGSGTPTAAAATPAVSLEASPTVSEGNEVVVTVQLSEALSNAVTIPLTFSKGTAEDGDYTALASITVAAGETIGTGFVMANEDEDIYDETFTVALGALPSSVAAGSPNSAAVTIIDTDATVATDKAALVALYNATDGANWTNNDNWLDDSQPLSSWRGVNTSSNGRVIRVNLAENNLSGTLPPELEQLTRVTRLSLYSNKLTGTIPEELGNLTNLTQLTASWNQLTGGIPEELGNLTNLTRLILDGNPLGRPIPPELGKLTSLTRLDASWAGLTGPIPAELGNLIALTRLSLYSNQLTGGIPAELGQLTNLTHLSLYGNKLTGTIPAALGQLNNLEILYLSSNNLSGPIPAELGTSTSLKVLTLWRNPMIGEIPSALIPVVNRGALVSFYDATNGWNWTDKTNWLDYTQPLAEWFGVITNSAGEVTELNLPGNGLIGEAPNGLLGLDKLQRLDLSGNPGVEGPLQKELRQNKNLNFLDVSGTGLCAPSDTAFQAWLASITYTGDNCGRTPPPPPPPPGPGGGDGPGGGGGGGPRQTVPGAPTNLQAKGEGEAVTLIWAAPEDDGGSAITDYEVRINRKNPWTSIGSTQTTHRVSGLVNGTAYVFEVRAVNRIGRGRASNRAEATPMAAEVSTLDFAHFANGTGIISDFVFVNVSPHPIRPAIYFYDRGGHLIDPESVVDVTVDLEVTEDGGLTVRTAMEPLGELTISTHGQGELVSGSVKVLSDGPIGGGVRYGVPEIGVAGVGTSPPVRDVLFPAHSQEGGIRTAAALHNLGAEAMGVRCRLMSGGVVLEETAIPLEANGQASWFIEDTFTATDTSAFLGSVRCTAPGRGRFTAIAVEMDAAQRIFNTLSVVEVNRGRAEATTLDFAHFANGTAWITDLVFVNLETQPSGPPRSPFHTAIPPARPAIYFYDTEGNPIAAESVMDITGDLEITEDGALTVRTEMEPLGVLTISTHGRGELVTGSVKVVSERPIGGMLRFDHPALGVAGVGASPPVSDVLFPVRRQEGGITTGVALHNLESSPGLVHCDLMREGVLLDAASIPLEANGQTAWLIDQAFPATDTSDFAGSVRCDAVGEDLFTAVALEMDPGNRIFTTLPVVPVPERTGRE